MKIILMTLVLSSITCLSFGVLVKMPSADILRERLAEVRESCLANKTTILSDLADVEKEHEEIWEIIEKSMHDYASTKSFDEMCKGGFFSGKPRIVKILLQDYPQAVEELRKSKKIW